MHERFCSQKLIIHKITVINENLTIFPPFIERGLLLVLRQCIHGPINSYHSFLWINLILCLHITGTLDNCMKKFDAENLIVDKMASL